MGHAEGRAVKEFKKLKPMGDVIGMLVDLDLEKPAVAFDLNGELQGACEVPKEPLWVVTHLDTEKDRVELEKPSLVDAPPANLDALSGALLDVSKGQRFYGNYSDEEDEEYDESEVEDNSSDVMDAEEEESEVEP